MQFHYALVDDLISREEFESRVEAKMQECGDLIDDVTAAMLVVGELGREHVKIGKLPGPSSLISLFGKVISVAAPKEFERQDGERGWVAHLILADETGQVRAVLWDEKAAAVAEIEAGDVLEVIGKPGGRQRSDIVVLALRKAPCEIECGTAVQPGLAPPERRDLTMRILHLGDPRTVTRRDGSTSEMIEGCVADGEKVARVVTWSPELFDDILPGMTIEVSGALAKSRSLGTEYVIDEKTVMVPASLEIPFSFSRLDELRGGGNWAVEASLTSLQPVRAFTTRDGRAGHVRNLVLSDETAHIRAVLWGDRALLPLVQGDRLALYNAQLREGRDGGQELHIGSGGFVSVSQEEKPGEAIGMEGTVIVTREGTYLDDGNVRFLVSGDLPHGHEVRVSGARAGERILVSTAEDIEKDAGRVRSLLEALARAP